MSPFSYYIHSTVFLDSQGQKCFHLIPFSVVVQVWQRIGFWNVIQQTRANTGLVADCLLSLLQHYNNDNSQRFTVILWSL
jgi:hypothetical protein